MLNFKSTSTGIELEYEGDRIGDTDWVRSELKDNDLVRISRIFLFTNSDVINPPSPTQDLSGFTYRFQFGTIQNNYVVIPGKVLNINRDIQISTSIVLKRSIFAAERNISIFKQLSELIENSNSIKIGGSDLDAIPWSAFEELLQKFPNTGELDRYAGARVHTIVADYLDGMKDARGRYEAYLDRKSAITGATTVLDLEKLKKLEIEKYILIRDLIQNALTTGADWPERSWQELMIQFLPLLFPKYIKVLENITIHDYYSNPPGKTNRYIDIALVDANGNIDIIEVKKPFEDKILRPNPYRGNSIPTSELSGSIMQAEKYLFHLSKWGVAGEQNLTKKYSNVLPAGMTIKISNPKSIIIVGRDQMSGSTMTSSQLLDFEVIKRKYANMMDIITYDDLLRRLNNTIAALGM